MESRVATKSCVWLGPQADAAGAEYERIPHLCQIWMRLILQLIAPDLVEGDWTCPSETIRTLGRPSILGSARSTL